MKVKHFIINNLHGSIFYSTSSIFFYNFQFCSKDDVSSSLHKSVQLRDFFWPMFFCVWTKYRDLQSKSLYSVRIWKNDYQEKHAYIDISHTVPLLLNL